MMLFLKILAYLLLVAMLAFIAGVAFLAVTSQKKPAKNSIIRRNYTEKI